MEWLTRPRDPGAVREGLDWARTGESSECGVAYLNCHLRDGAVEGVSEGFLRGRLERETEDNVLILWGFCKINTIYWVVETANMYFSQFWTQVPEQGAGRFSAWPASEF